MKLVLASKSPRRIQLLRELGLEFDIIPSEAEAEADPELAPEEAVQKIALSKGLDVARRVPSDALVLAADTLVYLDGEHLGKPRSVEEAKAMLRTLSGREHTVVTGIALIRGDRVLTEAERTEVKFRPLTDDEIDAYVATGEPMDKAGAYGAQGKGALLIEGLRGDYFNVVGLPVCRTALALRKIGFEVLK